MSRRKMNGHTKQNQRHWKDEAVGISYEPVVEAFCAGYDLRASQPSSAPVENEGNTFTGEEIAAAKATRDTIIKGDVEELKSIYMAGEIVMWSQLRQSSPSPLSAGEQKEDEKDFELLAEYDMKERLAKTIHHVLTKTPEANREQFLINLCNGMVGSAILHYRNKYEKKMNIKPFNQQM